MGLKNHEKMNRSELGIVHFSVAVEAQKVTELKPSFAHPNLGSVSRVASLERVLQTWCKIKLEKEIVAIKYF